MKVFLTRVLYLLVSRFARNLYFWALVFYVLWNNNTEDYRYPASVYRQFIPLTLLLLAVYTYLNNLWLVPRYLATKKYSRYAVLNGIVTIVMGFSLVVLIKAIRSYYPHIEIHHISILTSPVGPKWSLLDLLEETGWFALGLLIWEMVLTMAWYANQYYIKEKEADQYRHKQAEAELSMLRNQVNPHFLFNTLNNIYGLALRKTDEAPEAIMKLSSFMRYLLYEGSKERVSSTKEIEAMQAYIDLELLRISDHSGFVFTLETDKEYDMPGLVWLPILENAFKHGTRIISTDMFIDYRFTIKEGRLSISSRNYFKEETISNEDDTEGGTGLANLRKRLELLYQNKSTITVRTEKNIYSIHLELELK